MPRTSAKNGNRATVKKTSTGSIENAAKKVPRKKKKIKSDAVPNNCCAQIAGLSPFSIITNNPLTGVGGIPPPANPAPNSQWMLVYVTDANGVSRYAWMNKADESIWPEE